MTDKITEDAIEKSALQLLEHQGYSYVYGPTIAPDSDTPERSSFEEVVLVARLRVAALRINTRLHCHVVVELKPVKFIPEFAGKLNFYVAAVDDLLRGNGDNPTIGILICKSKNDTVVEYALKNTQQPIGVSEYELTRDLPEELKSALPSIEQIEAELGGDS